MSKHKKVKARRLFVDALPRQRSDAPAICTTQDAMTPNAVIVLPADAASTLQIHRQIKVAMDSEDGTGAGYDYAAWKVMHALRLTDKTWLQFFRDFFAP